MKALNAICWMLFLLTLAASGIGEGNRSVAEKGRFVTLKQNDGSDLRAFVAGLADVNGAVLVVHDYLGISDATKRSVEHHGLLDIAGLQSISMAESLRPVMRKL